MGLFGGEPRPPGLKAEIERRMHIVCTDNYGLTEVMGPGVSGECLAERYQQHIAEDHFLWEVIDPETGEPVGEGEMGELVLTPLCKQGIPVLRYRTHDLTAVHTEPCACGRTLARMDKVRSRSDDMLIIRGTNVFPSQIEDVLTGIELSLIHISAGNSFAGACDRGDGLLYAIVLGSPSEDARFQDTETLFNWVYDNRVSYALAHSPETVASAADGGAEVPLIARVSHSAWPDRTVAATFADPSAAVEVFAPEGNVSQEIVAEELTGSVAAGDVVGVANFYQGNELVASQDLIACEDSPAPGFLEGIGIWWNRLWGNDAPAPTEVVNETPLIYSKSSSREDHQSVAAIAAGVSDDAPADGAPSGAGAGAADAANE